MSTASDQTDDPNHRRKVLAAGGFAHFAHDGFTDTIYVLLPFWAEAFGLSLAQVGALKLVISGALSSIQVPAGLLAERVGERPVLVAGTLLAAAGFIGLGFSGGLAALVIGLLLIGFGAGTQHPLVSAVVSKAHPGHGRRAALGTYNFCGDLGKVAVPASVAAVTAAVGWRYGAVAAGLFGLFAGVLILILFRRLAVGGPDPRRPDHHAEAKAQGWGITDRRGFSALSVIAMIDSSVRYGFLTFLSFLLIGKGAPVETVGFALVLVFAGGAVGKLVCGLIAERVGILRTVIATEAATGVLLAALVALPLTPALFVLPFAGIALNGTSSVLYGTVADFVAADRQARAFGLFYSLGTGAGAVAPLCYGLVSDSWSVEVTFLAMAASVVLVGPFCVILRRSLAPDIRS